jgi:hypothetical protein
VVFKMGSLELFAWAGLEPLSSNLCLPRCLNYRCEPQCLPHLSILSPW